MLKYRSVMKTPTPPAGPESALEKKPKIRILVAEDDRLSREFICARLERWGYEVVVTQDGTEALTELLKEDAPRVAILDWMMPGIDGPEVCRRVRDAGKSVYLILLTAHTGRENAVESFRAGADSHMAKPCNKNELLERILFGLSSPSRKVFS
jgi:DNA-binding response OmpR family regulator